MKFSWALIIIIIIIDVDLFSFGLDDDGLEVGGWRLEAFVLALLGSVP